MTPLVSVSVMLPVGRNMLLLISFQSPQILQSSSFPACYRVIKGNLGFSFCLKIIYYTNKCIQIIFMIISCTGHLRINTLATIKQHSEKYVDYIGVFIANHKNKNLKFLRHKRIQLNLK